MQRARLRCGNKFGGGLSRNSTGIFCVRSQAPTFLIALKRTRAVVQYGFAADLRGRVIRCAGMWDSSPGQASMYVRNGYMRQTDAVGLHVLKYS